MVETQEISSGSVSFVMLLLSLSYVHIGPNIGHKLSLHIRSIAFAVVVVVSLLSFLGSSLEGRFWGVKLRYD